MNSNQNKQTKTTSATAPTEDDFTPEKDFKKRSKVVLKMIYFFQVLPFYIMQFCSGMSVGKDFWPSFYFLKFHFGIKKFFNVPFRKSNSSNVCLTRMQFENVNF